MLWIHFPKARYWVNVRDISAYISWNWYIARGERGRDLRQLLRQFWSPTPAFNTPEVLTRAFRVALKLDVMPGWTRFPTDGTRVQVFDAMTHRICKILLPDIRSSSLAVELIARQKVGSLAPPIISVNHKTNAYVEEWLAVGQPIYSLQVLKQALQHLQGTLYDIKWIDLDQFLGSLTKWGQVSDGMLQAAQYAFANLGSTARVPWTMVHGDLVEQNLLLSQTNKMVLIDWEYTRECIATYDCWLYQYNHERVLKRREVNAFTFKDLNLYLKELIGSDADKFNPYSLHLLHLIERIQYLAYVSPHTTGKIRQLMLSDMRQSYQELAERKF